MSARITVVGIGADGWAGLPAVARERVEAASVLLGGARHLELVPVIAGQERRPWPRPLIDLPAVLEEYGDRSLVALASGDPLLSGIGTTLIDMVGRDAVEVIPAVSSVALARARMGWSAESVQVVSLVGRDADALRRELAPGRRLIVLSSDETTPPTVAKLLQEEGLTSSRMTILGDLGAADERRIERTADDPWTGELPRLHVLALELAGPAHPATSWASGLPDEAFEHDGQLTKRDLRASALARLAPRPGSLLWDVGAGAGSVAIEWLRAHPTTRAIAVEADHGRAGTITRNAARLGAPRLEVVTGRAPGALAALPAPDAVFVGGGACDDVLARCLDVLPPGGRLVAHGVTLETEQLLAASYRRHGGELTRISVEHAAPLGERTGWAPLRTVTQWAVTR